MKTSTKWPQTRAQLEQLSEGKLMRFPASEKEYWELLETCEYRLDYHNHEMIAMSYENALHSKLVFWFGGLLHQLYSYKTYSIHGPNRPIYSEVCGSVFNPDASVVLEPSELYEYRPGRNAEKTPVLAIEVLSPTTRAYDLAEKLPCYKKIPSMRQIIYLETKRMFATVYDRIEDSDRWINVDYDTIEDSFEVNGQELKLATIYERVNLEDQ